METLQREAVYLWYYFDVQFRQIFLYWVLGMVVGSAVSVFLKEQISLIRESETALISLVFMYSAMPLLLIFMLGTHLLQPGGPEQVKTTGQVLQ